VRLTFNLVNVPVIIGVHRSSILREAGGRQRVLYMLDRAMKASGLLRPAKRDHIRGTRELLGDRQTAYREPCQLFRPLSENLEDETSTLAKFNADTLEADIAALIRDAGDSLRGPPIGGNWDAEEVTQVSTELREAAQDPASTVNNFDLRVNGGRLDRHTWNPHIKISDAGRISPPDSKATGRAFLTSVILVILGAGCALLASVGYFLLRSAPTPVANRAGSSIQSTELKNRVPIVTADMGGQVMANVPKADEIATLAARVSAERPDPARPNQQNRTTKSPPGVQQNAGSTRASTVGYPPKPSSRPMPFPETRPATMEGWTVQDVVGGTAVLQGPKGIRRVARGDTSPELGKVESIVRWGNRWIVATSKGLISSP